MPRSDRWRLQLCRPEITAPQWRALDNLHKLCRTRGQWVAPSETNIHPAVIKALIGRRIIVHRGNAAKPDGVRMTALARALARVGPPDNTVLPPGDYVWNR